MTQSNSGDTKRQGGELRAQTILESITDGFFALDRDWRFTYVNPQAERILDRVPGELLGKIIWDEYPGIHNTTFESVYRQAMNAGIRGAFTSFYPDHNRWYEVQAYPSPDGISIYFRDVSERKLAEDALRTSEERLAFSIDAAELGTFYCPVPLGLIIWNAKCKEHFWLMPDSEIDFKLFYSLLHPDDRERTQKAVEKAVFEHQPYDVEYRTVASDGRTRWVRAKGRAYYNDVGEPTRFDGVTLDITERKRADERDRLAAAEAVIAAESNAKFRTFFEQGIYFAGVMSLDGSVIEVNKLSLDSSGFDRDDVIGKKFWECGWWTPLLQLVEMIRTGSRLAAAGQVFRRESNYFIADGSERFVDLVLSPVMDNDGRVLFIAATGTDITDKKHLADERERLLEAERAARSEAERTGRMKDEFLATLSHELRTPLTAILGWSSVLRANTDPATVADGLAVIERNARAQARLVEDLLDMNRIISGKIQLEVRRIEMADVLTSALDIIQPSANAKGITLRTTVDSDSCFVSGDANRLQQVIWNLLTNAVKFTPAGGKIDVRLAQTHAQVEISVADTGRGIKSEFLPYVFERFRQEDASTTRQHGGLGLGLSIVKQLIELHAGSVGVESAGEGKGATFILRLPCAATPESGKPKSLPSPGCHKIENDLVVPDLHGVKVLIIDDDDDTRELIKQLFAQTGASIITANSALAGMDELVSKSPDIILSDIGMPNEDGYAFIRRVRGMLPNPVGRTPAVALTAFARSEDRTRAIRAGYHSHVPKPVDPSELFAVVASLVGRNQN